MGNNGAGRAATTTTDVLTRVPPQNLEAEMAVLGSILINNEAIQTANEILTINAFYREAHRDIYRAMLDLAGEHKPIDAITLGEVLRERGKLEACGGMGAIVEITMAVPTDKHVAHYARIVAEKAGLRAIASTATEIASMAFDNPEFSEFLPIVDDAWWKLREALPRRATADLPNDNIASAIERSIEAVFTGSDHATITGLERLDRGLQGGFKRNHLIVLGARTSAGKSALALQIAAQVKRGGVLVISNEMSREDLLQRAISVLAFIDWNELRKRPERKFTDTEFERVTNAQEHLSNANFEIVFLPKTTPQQVRELGRQASMRWDGRLDLIVVDYLQRMKADKKYDNRAAEIGDITNELKNIACELNCAVLVCAQLNRDVVKRGANARPTLADLKDSGSTEQDADEVLLLWYEKREEGHLQKMFLEVAKQRNGPTPRIPLTFDARYTRFDTD